MSKRRAIITGATGQDGSYLCELLAEKGYEVHGLVRHNASEKIRLQPSTEVIWHPGALDSDQATHQLMETTQPHEIYHLAAASHVAKSFDQPWEAAATIGQSTVRLLEAMRHHCPRARLFHASSAEIFGQPTEVPQTEYTAIAPVSPYGAAKSFATQMTRIYRQAHGLYCVNGILYNHESIRRGGDFVTRKICRGAAAISLGLETTLQLGNIEASRDWGYAPDYVSGMWRSLQADAPTDYIFATGTLRKVRDVLDIAFDCVGLDWTNYVVIDKALYRPTEPSSLIGDPGRAHEILGWQAETGFETLIREMTQNELSKLSRTRVN